MSKCVFQGAELWPGDGTTVLGHLVVENGVIQAVNPGPYRGELASVYLSGLSLSPGMIDLMLLGGFGCSILRDDPLTIAAEYLKLGVTACQLCVGTLPWESMLRVAESTRAAMTSDRTDAARILGLYLEGPFQQPDLTGASLREHALVPSPENVERILSELGATVTMVNVAPGLDNAADAVRRFREAGKVVSMAHSNAAVEAVRRCVDAGTTVLGHVWDNNSGRVGDSGVQQPTLEHVALTDDRIRSIHLICDGTHVHPVMIDIILRCRGVESVCLVTDGNQRSGCPDGPFQSDDGRRFTKADGVCRTDSGWLAGSALLLPDMFRCFVRFTGLSPAAAIQTVTRNPAASLGLEHRLGLLAPDRLADFVAWDRQLQVRRVWRSGREVRTPFQFRGGADVTTGRFDLTGKTALVTGGSRGIGRGIALGLAEHGADVAIVYRSASDQAAQVVSAIQRIGRQAWSWQEDLARTDRLAALVDRAWEACGRIDILVNNAAMSYLEAYDAITPEHWRQTLAVNLDAVFFLTQHVARKMVTAGTKGRIINISSTNGLVAEAGLAHYNASKGGLELLTKSLAIELGEHGITVNSIAPGLIETEIHSGFELDPAFFREHIPLEHRFGNVEECVGGAVFLASPAGSYVTGHHLVIDGGLLCEQFPRLRFMKPGH